MTNNENYRPIVSSAVMSQVLERVLIRRHEDKFDSANNQFGFKKNYSTETCNFCILPWTHYL